MATPVGKLRYRVKIQTPSGTTDVLGGKPRSWTDVATIWAAIDDLAATRWAGMALLDGATHAVTIRPYSALTTRHAILWGTRRFTIKQIMKKDPLLWVLTCEEGEVD